MGKAKIGILIVSHGKFPDGILDAMRLIAGEQEKVETIQLNEGDPVDQLTDRVLEKIELLNCPDGVLILVDMFGASPYIACAKFAHEHPEKNIIVITGVNLPMVLEAAVSRDAFSSLQELGESLVLKGRDQIRIFPEA